MEFIQQLPISPQTAKIISKVLYRATSSIERLPQKICPNCKEKQPRDNQLMSSELKVLHSVILALNKAVEDYVKAQRAELENLGELGFMDGDGLLRTLYGYRAFIKGDLGETSYLGTFDSVQKARDAWLEKKPGFEVDVYEWVKDTDGNWHVAQFMELGDDEEVQKWVTETAPQGLDEPPMPLFAGVIFPRPEKTPDCKTTILRDFNNEIFLGDTEGFRGSDFDHL